MVCKTVIRGFDSHLRLQRKQPQFLTNQGHGAFLLDLFHSSELYQNGQQSTHLDRLPNALHLDKNICFNEGVLP